MLATRSADCIAQLLCELYPQMPKDDAIATSREHLEWSALDICNWKLRLDWRLNVLWHLQDIIPSAIVDGLVVDMARRAASHQRKACSPTGRLPMDCERIISLRRYYPYATVDPGVVDSMTAKYKEMRDIAILSAYGETHDDDNLLLLDWLYQRTLVVQNFTSLSYIAAVMAVGETLLPTNLSRSSYVMVVHTCSRHMVDGQPLNVPTWGDFRNAELRSQWRYLGRMLSRACGDYTPYRR